MNQNKSHSSQRLRRALRDYQRKGLYYICDHINPAVYWEMRLGKTLTVLRGLDVRFSKVNRGCLIVAPYSALHSWQIELKKEGFTDTDFIFLTGTRQDRAWNLCFKRRFYLLNKEGWSSVPQVANICWDAVVLDESNFIKNPKAQVTRFFCNNFRDVKSRWVMTGTPAPESELDYFEQMRFLDPSIFGFKNFYEFRNQFFVQTFRGKYSPTMQGEKFINERLAKNCSYLMRDDVNLNVKKIFTKRNIKMKVKAWKTMQTWLREFILETDEKFYGVTDSAGAKFVKARRICGGFVEKDFLFKEKMNELLNLLKFELANIQVIVYTEYIDEVKLISKLLTKEGISNDYIYGGNRESRFDILDSFISGNIRILVGQTTCFKVGVDLSCADTIIYYSLPMSGNTFQQSQDRIINVTTKITGHIISLICENTIEEDIYLTMVNKESKETMNKRIKKRIQENIK